MLACEPPACLKFPGMRPSGHTSLGLFAMLASLQQDYKYPNKNSRLSSGRQISDGTASKMSIMKKFVWAFFQNGPCRWRRAPRRIVAKV
jgi:hypothetical protein